MKKIISLIITALITLLSSCSSTKTKVDPILDPIYKEWKKDAKTNNVDIKQIESKVRLVLIGNLRDDKLGVYYSYLNIIRIDEKLLDYPKSLRAVFYHEMGHAAGIPHTCKVCLSIMSVSRNIKSSEKSFYFEEIWQKEVKEYFKTIKDKQNEKFN